MVIDTVSMIFGGAKGGGGSEGGTGGFGGYGGVTGGAGGSGGVDGGWDRQRSQASLGLARPPLMVFPVHARSVAVL